jgi:hypothetical protein
MPAATEHKRCPKHFQPIGKIAVKNAGEIDIYFVTRPKPAKG